MGLSTLLIIGGIALFVISLFGGWHESSRKKKMDSRNWTSEDWQEFLKDTQKRLDEI